MFFFFFFVLNLCLLYLCHFYSASNKPSESNSIPKTKRSRPTHFLYCWAFFFFLFQKYILWGPKSNGIVSAIKRYQSNDGRKLGFSPLLFTKNSISYFPPSPSSPNKSSVLRRLLWAKVSCSKNLHVRKQKRIRLQSRHSYDSLITTKMRMRSCISPINGWVEIDRHIEYQNRGTGHTYERSNSTWVHNLLSFHCIFSFWLSFVIVIGTLYLG